MKTVVSFLIFLSVNFSNLLPTEGRPQSLRISTSSSNPFLSEPARPGGIYILRRKIAKQPLSEDILSQSPTLNSFSIPILSQDQSQSHRRYDSNSDSRTNIFNTESSTSKSNGPAEWVSLEQAFAINKALQEHNHNHKQPFTITNIQLESNYDINDDTRTPITVEGSETGSNNGFRSNIPLPHNPFMPNTNAENQLYKLYSDNTHIPETFVPEDTAEQGLQNVLHKYLEKIHNSNPNSRSDSYNPITHSNNFRGQQSHQQKSTYGSNHYTKPGSSESIRRFPSEYQPELFTAESRQSSSIRQGQGQGRDTFASVLSKLQKIQQIKEAFPPHGSYTPYGERTIIMMKYPGLPERQRFSANEFGGLGGLGYVLGLGGIKPISLAKDNWSTVSGSGRPAKIKESDFGVIISQNYILQPETSVNSHYNSDAQQDGNESKSPGDLLSQLATALAERNQILNSYSSSLKGKGKPVSTKPPFVLVHLETFSKKSNKTTRFGFDEEIETNYSNGTIIYPTLNDPSVLASTKFEFESVEDVEQLFERPLEGYKNGGMRPIVPLGLVDIQNYLKLMYEVHKDIHDGGKAKVDELKGLSYVVDRQTLPGARTLDQWERERGQGRYKDNWLHTSSIGLRSLGDYPPPPPKLPVPYPPGANLF